MSTSQLKYFNVRLKYFCELWRETGAEARSCYQKNIYVWTLDRELLSLFTTSSPRLRLELKLQLMISSPTYSDTRCWARTLGSDSVINKTGLRPELRWGLGKRRLTLNLQIKVFQICYNNFLWLAETNKAVKKRKSWALNTRLNAIDVGLVTDSCVCSLKAHSWSMWGGWEVARSDIKLGWGGVQGQVEGSGQW